MKAKSWWGVFVIVGALAMSSSMQAQTPVKRGAKVDFGRFIKSCKNSLHSEISGIVDGALFNLIDYKSEYPDRDYSGVIAALNDFAHENSDPSLVYKATLTKMYLAFGTKIKNEVVLNPEDHAQAFRVVAEQLEKQLLVSRMN
jgi:hypothetical protein